MNVTSEIQGLAAVVACKGELTADVLGALKQAVEGHLQDAALHDVVLNLEGVPFLDSAALEYLLELQEHLAERLGQVKLAAVDANVGKILEITRLDSAFARYDTAAEAAQAL